jgi:hypothetical protein
MGHGRKSLIHRADIKDPAHLALLDPIEQDVIRYRWGMTTGDILTQHETADKIGTTRERVRRIEARAAEKIIAHLQSTPRLGTDAVELMRRIEQLEATVRTIARIVDDVMSTVAALDQRIDEEVARDTAAVPGKPKRRLFGVRS